MAAVIITVRGGVAEYTTVGDVRVVLIDFDNLTDDDTTAREIREALAEVKALPTGDEDWNKVRGEIVEELEGIAEEAVDDQCQNCGEVMSKDCAGEYRCEFCDDPCPKCHDGGGPGGDDDTDGDEDDVIEDEPGPYRVTYFSNWQRPEHHENLSEGLKNLMVHNGKAQQFKVVVTQMTEDAPETWG